jgi:hypothetical protein
MRMRSHTVDYSTVLQRQQLPVALGDRMIDRIERRELGLDFVEPLEVVGKDLNEREVVERVLHVTSCLLLEAVSSAANRARSWGRRARFTCDLTTPGRPSRLPSQPGWLRRRIACPAGGREFHHPVFWLGVPFSDGSGNVSPGS